MHPDTRKVAASLKDFGLRILGFAIYEATFADMSGGATQHALAVAHAAHGAEIILKARIAQEHPLLIFQRLPPASGTTGLLSLPDLLERGRTYSLEDLPDVLWAASGHRLMHAKEILEFGRLRNRIMHFVAPEMEHSDATLRFVVTVLDPLIDEFWKESAIPYASEHDPETIDGGYLEERIICLGIQVNARLRAILGPQSESGAKALLRVEGNDAG